MKVIRKGSKVRYIGKNELMKNKTYEVIKKQGNSITLYAPCKYANGEIHNVKCSMDISEFEIAN